MNQKLTEQMIKESRRLRLKMNLKSKLLMIHRKLTGIVSLLSHLKRLLMKSLRIILNQVQKRIKHFSKGYHDERRAKEAAIRERDELERFVKSIQDENTKLKGSVNKNQTALVEQAKKTAEVELAQAKNAYKMRMKLEMQMLFLQHRKT